VADARSQSRANEKFSVQIMDRYRSGEKLDRILQDLVDKTMEADFLDLSVPDGRERSIHPWDLLGNTLIQEGKLDQAVLLYAKLIELMKWGQDKGRWTTPLFGLAYNNLGVVYLKKGYPDKAVEYFWAALRWDCHISNVNLPQKPSVTNLEIAVEQLATFAGKKLALQAEAIPPSPVLPGDLGTRLPACAGTMRKQPRPTGEWWFHFRIYWVPVITLAAWVFLTVWKLEPILFGVGGAMLLAALALYRLEELKLPGGRLRLYPSVQGVTEGGRQIRGS